MPEIWAGELGEFRATSTAGGGTALTSTAGFIQFPALEKAGDHKKGHLFLTPRNFSTAVVVKVALNPWLTVLKTTDNMATLPTDYSITAQDNSTSSSPIDVSSLSTVANGDWVLVGCHQQIRGFYIDVLGTNSLGTAALAVAYWNGGSFIDRTTANSLLTDGTFSTRTFAQDGLVSWTSIVGEAKTTFRKLYPELKDSAYFSDIPLYWYRVSVSAALTDTSVTFDSLTSANRSTNYAELLSGQSLEQTIVYGFGGLGNIEALTDAGTANLIVNVATIRDGEFA